MRKQKLKQFNQFYNRLRTQSTHTASVFYCKIELINGKI